MPDLYDTDFFAWTQTQAAALAAGHVGELDLANLAEEIESLGKSDRRALRSDLRILLMHLLKWLYQPELLSRESHSWEDSIIEHRIRIDGIVADSPSLSRQVPELMVQAYRQARRQAAAQTRLPLLAFPDTCPWTVAQVLDDDFFPEATP